jgi:hypothetical protein
MRSKYGFDAEEIPMQEVQNEIVSSTKIREAITEGYMQRANAYLDHYYIIIGTAEPTGDNCFGSGDTAVRHYLLPKRQNSPRLRVSTL